MVSVSLSDMMKPAVLDEEMAESNPTDTRSNMVLRAGRRWRMNVGDPNDACKSAGIGLLFPVPDIDMLYIILT